MYFCRYTGLHCEVDIDECASDPCLNGGQCTDRENGYTCLCAPPWTGQQCNLDSDDCLSSPCMNGATCTDHVGFYSCTCSAGFTGVF